MLNMLVYVTMFTIAKDRCLWTWGNMSYWFHPLALPTTFNSKNHNKWMFSQDLHSQVHYKLFFHNQDIIVFIGGLTPMKSTSSTISRSLIEVHTSNQACKLSISTSNQVCKSIFTSNQACKISKFPFQM